MRKISRSKIQHGQSIIEFTFAMILVALLIFGLIRIFQWSGLVLAEHRIEHDRSLTASRNPVEQLNANYFTPRKMDAVFRWDE